MQRVTTGRNFELTVWEQMFEHFKEIVGNYIDKKQEAKDVETFFDLY